MQNAYEALMAIGFSTYEAQAYCALLADSPANGYQVAKRSGVPRAKIYECLERLVARGAAVRVDSSETTSRTYAAIDFRELIDDVERSTAVACQRAREALDRVQNDPRVVEVLWRVTSEEDLIARGRNLAENAQQTLHVALWPREFEALLESFLGALDRNVRMALVLYSNHQGIKQLQQRGAGAIVHSGTKLQAVPVMGKQFVVVADRTRCIVGSLFPERGVEGVFTMDRGLVTNAVDLVNHEIYLERILLEVGKPVLARYGRNLDKLDSFDRPASAGQKAGKPAAGRRKT